jgi:hypothetical protein
VSVFVWVGVNVCGGGVDLWTFHINVYVCVCVCVCVFVGCLCVGGS